jgi:hypothetical protein
MASVIQGAIGEYLANRNLAARVGLEAYSAELVNLFDKAILNKADEGDANITKRQ